MKSTYKILASATVTGVALTGLMTGTALAWHPVGKIHKYVQNVTQNGQMVEADTAADAVSAKPGDTLKYTIVVSNEGDKDSKGWNDMAKTVMTDTLPDGIVMADGSSSSITVNMGTIKPGEKVTKEYLVKVVSETDGDLIENKACFTGDSTVNDNPQHDCNVANVTVEVPETPQTPETPTPTPTPTPQVESTTTELPNTGVGSLVLPAGIAGSLGYLGNLLRIKRKQR